MKINNSIYNTLGERWYTANDDPIALLRAENKLKCPWVIQELQKSSMPPSRNVNILDLGCGGGFLTNYCADLGYSVTGVDLSKESLDIAKQYDTSQKVHYVQADCYALPFEKESFSVVSCMDFLEHVQDPRKIILEASRVLKPGGLFFFHTFNRNPLSYIFIIKCVEWLVKNTPPNLHLYNLFIKPSELNAFCSEAGLLHQKTVGIKPKFFSKAFWQMVGTGKVSESFAFELTSSTLLSYLGYAKKSI